MIILRAPSEYSEITYDDARYYDNRIIINGTARTTSFSFRNKILRTQTIGDMAMPFIVNDVELYQQSYVIDPTTDINEFIDAIKETTDNTKYTITRVYTVDVDVISDLVKEKLEGSKVIEELEPLFTKCSEQVGPRLANYYYNEAYSNYKIKHLVYETNLILFVNAQDEEQGYDMCLALGILPLIYEDIKYKFSDTELFYCKELVRRSQLKRPTNIDATTKFNALFDSTKYVDKKREVMIQATAIAVYKRRVNKAYIDVENESNYISESLKSYADHITKYKNAQKILNNIESGQKEMEDEIKAALKIEGVVNTKIRDNNIVIGIRQPIKFYDVDEAELSVKHRGKMLNNFVKKVFIDCEYKMYIYAQFIFAYSDNISFSVPSSVDYNTLSTQKALFNPHYQYYGCLGDYRPQLAKAFAEKDLYTYISIATTALGAINFSDGAVMRHWFDDIANQYTNYNTNWSSGVLLDTKCIEDKQGNLISMKELLDICAEVSNEPEEIEVRDSGE